MTVRITRNHFVRVEVLDPGPMFNPDPRPPGTGAGSGRGLYLVDAVATAWGVEPDEAGKKVRFELRLAAGWGGDVGLYGGHFHGANRPERSLGAQWRARPRHDPGTPGQD